MGGVRVNQLPKDTVKSCVKSQPAKIIKGKVKFVEPIENKQQIKMGEVIAIPAPTKSIPKSKK
jgi:hypothetical protein